MGSIPITRTLIWYHIERILEIVCQAKQRARASGARKTVIRLFWEQEKPSSTLGYPTPYKCHAKESKMINDIITREELILAIEARDGVDCFLCKKPFQNGDEVTIDHWYPQSVAYAEGWTYEQVNDLSNLRKAHRPCNTAKSDIVPNPDGTLPKRPSKERAIKVPRPMSCDTCMNGRILLLGEFCPDCNSGPQPRAFPKTLQKIPKECDHSFYHCFMCVIGFYDRKPVINILIEGT